jgi:hypothetical protein
MDSWYNFTDMDTSLQTFELKLNSNDLAFLEREAELNQISLQNVVEDAISLYRKRAHELREELGEGCCGGGCCGDACSC